MAAIKRAIRAKLLSTVNYGSLAYPGALDRKLNNIQCTCFKRLFGLPPSTRNTLIQLEFALILQNLESFGSMAKYYYHVLQAKANTLNKVLRVIVTMDSNP